MKVFLNVVWAFALAATAAAQGLQTGTLRGVVHDPQGLVVASATVTITSPAMQAPRSTTTDDHGRYAFPSLPPGEYQVTIERQAFDAWTANVAVPLGLDVASDATLTARAAPPSLAHRIPPI